ncbi:MAG: PilZ domain-containing protein [Ectothiorhodospiraceae bacterium]|nr:PilZ domain-containing protein [Ectothiorhodospiraceae bacterium]
MDNQETTTDLRDPLKNDKRKFSRIPFDTDIHLVSAEGSWHCQLLDVSLKGILATSPKGWQAKIGDHYLIEMLIGNQEAAIRMEVSVMHIEDDHTGYRCEHIDLDSITHLRRLVELNLGDSDILDRELSELSHV